MIKVIPDNKINWPPMDNDFDTIADMAIKYNKKHFDNVLVFVKYDPKNINLIYDPIFMGFTDRVLKQYTNSDKTRTFNVILAEDD
jgi:hypothetical protein